MKGVVFTEFMDLVDEKFSPEILEKVLEKANPPNGGAYTAVGTYDHGEILAMVTALSEEVDLPVPTLVKVFGQHLFGQFMKKYPMFGAEDTFSMLERVDNHIHVEVRKLYPDAALPKFDFQRPADNVLIMDYRSTRPFADLAEGLILGCAEHYGETIALERETLDVAEGFHTRFTLTRHD